MAYTTQAHIEAYEGRVLTDSEVDLLNIVLAAVDSYIDSEIGGTFNADALPSTKKYDGGSVILQTDAFSNVTAVEGLDKEGNIVHTYIPDVDYVARPVNDGIKHWIEKKSGSFPRGLANMAVTATYSLGDVPDDIVLAATHLASKLLSDYTKKNVQSESIEGYSVTLANMTEEDTNTRMILDQYRDNMPLI